MRLTHRHAESTQLTTAPRHGRARGLCEATRRSHPGISPRLRLPHSTHIVQLFCHNTMSSATTRTSTPSNFEALFDAALEKYTKRTGQDLRNYELARMLDRCESPDEILAIFKEQSQEFDKFRNDDPKLIKWLTPIVDGLHAISTSAAISAGASLVSLTQYPISLPISFNSFP